MGSAIAGSIAFGFVGDRLVLQHISLTIGSLIFGVAIPLTYLLNETRVRDVILNQGWAQGFKSIFYSSKKIKQIKRKKKLNSLHSRGFPLPSNNFSGRSASFRKAMHKHILLTKQSYIEHSSDNAEGLIQLTNSPQNISKQCASTNFRNGCTNLSSHKGCTTEQSTDYNVVNVNAIVHCLIEPNLNKDNVELNESRKRTTDSTEQLEGLLVHHRHDREDTTHLNILASSAQTNTAKCDTVGMRNVQGFKSIHYSCKKIRQIEKANKFRKKTHS